MGYIQKGFGNDGLREFTKVLKSKKMKDENENFKMQECALLRAHYSLFVIN